jgi:hypothetical protein
MLSQLVQPHDMPTMTSPAVAAPPTSGGIACTAVAACALQSITPMLSSIDPLASVALTPETLSAASGDRSFDTHNTLASVPMMSNSLWDPMLALGGHALPLDALPRVTAPASTEEPFLALSALLRPHDCSLDELWYETMVLQGRYHPSNSDSMISIDDTDAILLSDITRQDLDTSSGSTWAFPSQFNV